MEKVVLTNMCMIYDDEGNILVQDRKKTWCGVAFPGGHVEAKESIIGSTIREIKEETGLDIFNLKICGIKQWFSDDVRYICFLFKTNCYKGDLISSDEGKNFWIKKSDLNNFKLANKFEIMYQVFNNEEINECFHIKKDNELLDLLI